MSDAYPRFYSTDGTPARIQSRLDLPEIYVGNGKWEQYSDRFDLVSNATPISSSEADALAKKFDAKS